MAVRCLVAILVLFAPACGGSSSETPPPLEPDPRALGPAPSAGRVAPGASAAPRSD